MLTRIQSAWNSPNVLVGMQNVIASLESSWQSLTKLHVHSIYNKEILCLDIYSNEMKTYVLTKVSIPIAAVFIIAQNLEQHKICLQLDKSAVVSPSDKTGSGLQ